MIRDMAKSKPQSKPQQSKPKISIKKKDTANETKETKEIWNVHAREFMYDSVAEYEAAFPPAKRPKIKSENDEYKDNSNSINSMAGINMNELCDALDEIAKQIEIREQGHQKDNAEIAVLIENILQNQKDIELLLGYIEDTKTGIFKCQERINIEMEKIAGIVDRNKEASKQHISQISQISVSSSLSSSPTTTFTALPNITEPTNTTSTTNTSSTTNILPVPVPVPAFDPNHYQCRECSQMFDPRIQGYWLIGPNPETGDTFYLCRECTGFMEADEIQPTKAKNDEDNQDDDYDYEYDGRCDCGCEDYMCNENYYYDSDYDDQPKPKYGDYNHEEECS
jgi:hypothetical protein